MYEQNLRDSESINVKQGRVARTRSCDSARRQKLEGDDSADAILILLVVLLFLLVQMRLISSRPSCAR